MAGQLTKFRTKLSLLQPAEGEVVTLDIPPVGFYMRLWLNIRGTINTIGGSPNPNGIASLLRRVRVFGNATSDIFNLSGFQYNYLFRPHLDLITDQLSSNNGREAVAAATPVNLDMVIPFNANLRDNVGVIVGGNRQALFQLQIERAPDSEVGVTAWTDQPTIQPWLEFGSVPADPAQWPQTTILHEVLGEQVTIAGPGEFRHQVVRGGTYVGLYYGFGAAEISTPTAADNWDRFSLILNQTTRLMTDETPESMDTMMNVFRGQERVPGTINYDPLGAAGLGSYDRGDWLKTQYITQVEGVINAITGPTYPLKLDVVRRQFMPISITGQPQQGPISAAGGARGR